MSNDIYMDNMATTPVDPRVTKKMLTCLGVDGDFANPSVPHVFGKRAKQRIEEARNQVAKVINADPQGIIFTSGATESDNLALKGIAEFYQRNGKHIITTQIEHKAILKTCAYLEKQGFDITYLPVSDTGLVNPKAVEEAIREDTILISVMHFNNEVGTIQDIGAIGEIARSKGIFFHTDAAQSIGRLPVDVDTMNLDIVSLCAHKSYGPKGIGALYIRPKPKIRLAPMIHGGGHEHGLRSGTMPTHQIVAMGEAFEIAENEREKDWAHVAALHQRFYEQVKDIEGFYVNGDREQRVPHNIHIRFDGIPASSIREALPNIAISAESACNSIELAPSYVLTAMGQSDKEAFEGFRMGIGRFTTETEIDTVAAELKRVVKALRQR